MSSVGRVGNPFRVPTTLPLAIHFGDSLGRLATVNGFIEELKRRKVIRIAIAYVALGAGLIELSSSLKPEIVPVELFQYIVVLVALGFPVALVLSWIYELTPDGMRQTLPSVPVPGSELASIAVLPFRNLTSDSELAYLAEVLPLELNNALSRVHMLRVVSHRSSSAHRATDHGLRVLAAELGVQYAISGAITRANDPVRVVVELSDAQTESVLWTHSFTVETPDLSRLPDDVAAAVASEFGGQRLRAEIGRLAAHAPENATAWQRVQMSRAYLLEYSEANLARALANLKAAIDLDPAYAVAHATLAQVLAERTLAGISEEPDKDRQEALAAVVRAESLAPRDPVVLRAAGSVYAYGGHYRQSVSLLRRALGLAPYDFGTWGYLGWPLVATGHARDLEELLEILERLLTAAPRHPGRPYWLFHRSVALMCSGEAAASIEPARQSLIEQPSFAICGMHLANALGLIGQSDEARAAAGQCEVISPRFTAEYYAGLMAVLSDQPAVVEMRTSGLRQAGILREPNRLRTGVSETA